MTSTKLRGLFLLFFFMVFILMLVLFLNSREKNKTQSSQYLFSPQNSRIYHRFPDNKIKFLSLPYKGKINGFLLSYSSVLHISVNGKEFFFTKPVALEFNGEKVKLDTPKKGRRLAFHEKSETLIQGKFRKGDVIKLPDVKKLYRVLYKKKREKNVYSFSYVVITGKYEVPEDGYYVILKGETRAQWEDFVKEMKKINYLRLNSNTYQVIPAFPNTQMEATISPEENKRLHFSTIVMNLPPEFGDDIDIGDGVEFKIIGEFENGIHKTLFRKISKKGFYEYTIRIPGGIKKLIFFTHKNKNVFGDLAFWVSPYLFKKQKKTDLIILVSLDTVRAKSLSLYGNKRKTTPFLDSWAPHEAEIYTRAYTPHPWTYAAHKAALFSSYVWERPEKSLAEQLQELGYYTVAFTGGNFVSAHYGFCRGFVRYYEYALDVFDPLSGEKLFKKARNFIKNNKGKKIFMFLHTYQAHTPYNPPENSLVFGEKGNLDLEVEIGGFYGGFKKLNEKMRKKAKLLYEEEIYALDQNLIKPLVLFLKKKRIYNSSLLIIFADHGEQFYEHGSWTHGYSLYNEETHVPLIIKSPTLEKGVDNHPISLVVIPTIIAKAKNFKPHDSWKKRSKTIYMSTSSTFHQMKFPVILGIIKQDKKLVYNLEFQAYKFSGASPRPKYEYYELARDSTETKNLYFKRRKKARALLNLLKKFFRDVRISKRDIPSKDLDMLKSLGYI